MKKRLFRSSTDSICRTFVENGNGVHSILNEMAVVFRNSGEQDTDWSQFKHSCLHIQLLHMRLHQVQWAFVIKGATYFETAENKIQIEANLSTTRCLQFTATVIVPVIAHAPTSSSMGLRQAQPISRKCLLSLKTAEFVLSHESAKFMLLRAKLYRAFGTYSNESARLENCFKSLPLDGMYAFRLYSKSAQH